MGYFDQDAADFALFFFETYLKHTQDQWSGRPFIPAKWQREAIEQIYGLREYEAGPRQLGMVYLEVPKKPLALDTPIATPDGWKRLGELRSGDTVFNECGVPCKVVGLSPIFFDRKCFAVKFSDGQEIVADEDHEWITQTHQPHNRIATRTTGEIRDSLMYYGMRNHSIPVAGALKLPEKELPLDPWLFGYWLGNGTAGVNVVTCGLSDLPFVKTRIELSGHNHSVTLEPRAAVIRIDPGDGRKSHPSPFVTALRDLSVFTEKKIPTCYLRASISQRRALLSGLLDSDGDTAAAGSCRFATSSARVRDDVYELIMSLGYQVRISESRAILRGRDYGPCWRLFFTAFRSDPVFTLPRKGERQRVQKEKASRTAKRYIASVTEVPSVPVRCITVDSPSHLFLAGSGMIPTRNSGKTELCAGLVLLTLFLDEQLGCQVYGAAAGQKQALNVFRAAHAMVKQSPVLHSKFKVIDSTYRIVKRTDPTSFYAAIAADGDLSDGCNPSFSCLDELHRWTERKQFENYDVLTKGGITRRESITVAITTAGTIDKSPLAWRLHNKTLRINQKIHDDPKFYGRIYAADKTDDWTSPETWVKANPSLEGNPGGFVPISKYHDEYISAQTDRLAQSSFKRYFLNLWDESGERAFDPKKWDMCHGDFTNPGLSPRLPEQAVRSYPHEFLERFLGRICYPGVDLSFTNDMSALVLVFPAEDGYFDVLPFYWVPGENIRTRELHDGMSYRDWADQGYIEFCPGDAIDYREIKARLLWAAELFDVRDMCFDRYNSREMSTQLIDEGHRCVEVSQGYDGMNEPVKKLLELVNGTQKLRHGGHPIMRWNMLCADIEMHNDLVKFVKPERNKATARIDGLTAAATAMSRALLELGPSVYESRGVQSV